mgnify:CR=1 FL=1
MRTPDETLYGRARGPAVAHPTGPIGPTPRRPSIVPRGRSVLGTRSGLFPRVGPTGSQARLRGARAPYGRVLGTHGRPAMGTCWWPPKGPRIPILKIMVGDVPPWHDISRAPDGRDGNDP